MELNIYYQNTQGLRSKLHDFYLSVLDNEYSVVCICESWLKDCILDSELFNTNYSVYRRDREMGLGGKTDGGGVLMAVSSDLWSCAKPEWSNSGVCENLWISIKLNGGKFVHLCCVYVPPHASVADITSLSETMNRVFDLNPNDDILIVGDFNFPYIKWENSGKHFIPTNYSSSRESAFIDFYSEANLFQFSGVKNSLDRQLDLVFATAENSVTVNVCDEPLVPENHHHKSLLINYSSLALPSAPVAPRLKRNFAAANYDRINEEIASVGWRQILDGLSTEEAVDLFYEKLTEILNKNVTFKHNKRKDFPLWFSGQTISILKEKSKFHRKWKHYRQQRDYDMFSILRRRGHASRRDDYRRYLDKIENEISTNVKSFWSFVKNKRRRTSIPSCISYNGVVADDGPNLCSLFLAFFASVFEPNDSPVLIPNINNQFDAVNISHITKNQIIKEIRKLDVSKGDGHDGILPLFIKSCSLYILKA